MTRKTVLAGGGSVAALALVLAARRRPRHAEGAATLAGPGFTGEPAAEIAPGVHLLGPRGRTQTNAYLVCEGSSWVLVDAGWAGHAPRIGAAARSLLGPGRAPAAVLLTHAHPDHAGSARELAEAWGCPVYAHPAEIPLATGDFAAMTRYAGPLDRWLILPVMRAIGRRRREAALAGSSLAGVVRPLGPGGDVPGLDGWAWVHTPGHTPGHVAYVRARDGVVLSGDAVLTLEVNAWEGLLLGRQGLSRAAPVHDLGRAGGDRLGRPGRRPRAPRARRRPRPAAGGPRDGRRGARVRPAGRACAPSIGRGPGARG